jgi:hypothetical protein
MLAFVLGLMLAPVGTDLMYPPPPARSMKGLQQGLALLKARLFECRIQKGMTEQEVKKVLGKHVIESGWQSAAYHLLYLYYPQYGLEVRFSEAHVNGSDDVVPLVSEVQVYPHLLQEWGSELLTGSKDGFSKPRNR